MGHLALQAFTVSISIYLGYSRRSLIVDELSILLDKYFSKFSNLSLIDYVVIINDYTAVPAIKNIRPNYYFKGNEYRSNDF